MILKYVERHPWWTLVFLVAGGSAIAKIVRAARGTGDGPGLLSGGAPPSPSEIVNGTQVADTSQI